ncbi:Reverse transcriptase family protein, partial [Thalictrum thalictroides]
MMPSVPEYLLENEIPPIRHNEPNSQINEDKNIHLKANKQVSDIDYSTVCSSNDVDVSDPDNPSYFGLLTPDESMVEDSLESQTTRRLNPLPSSSRSTNHSLVDERNILTGPRTRFGNKKVERMDPSAFITEFNAFIVGQAKPLQRLNKLELPPPPENWRRLKSHPHAREFNEAMRVEYNALLAKNTIQPVKQTNSMHPIPLKWVFTYKFDEAGYLLKFKARICVRGDLQAKSEEDNYAATLAFQIFRLLVAIITYFDLETIQVDAVNAFCNSPLDDEVYLYNPPGFSRNGYVLRLLRGLYGLRKSPKLWLKLLSGTLTDIGLHQVPGQPCIFTDFKGIIVFFYVDDIVLAFPTARKVDAMSLLKNLTEQYEFRLLGELEWFLGVKISRDRAGKKLWLSQEAYIEKICHDFNILEPERRINTPMITDKLPKSENPANNDEIKIYQRKVGSLIYAAGVTRPDISRTVSHLAEFMTNPSPSHQEATDRCFFYLLKTKKLCIEYSGSNSTKRILHCSADASFGNTGDRRSVQGFVFKLFGGPIHLNSSKQHTVTTSSTEAELLALSHATKELIWMQRVLLGIRLDTDQEVEIFNDNIQTLRLLTKEDPLLQTKLKHVDIYQHWLRERVQSKEIKVSWIKTNDMVADGMTK